MSRLGSQHLVERVGCLRISAGMEVGDACGQNRWDVHDEFSNDMRERVWFLDDIIRGRPVRRNFAAGSHLYNAFMPSKNYGWMWYFAIVLVLSIVATVITVRYNFAMQLKPEMLDSAQTLWNEKGPKEYLLAYTIKINKPGASESETHYVVKVKDGKAFEAKVNGIAQAPERMVWYGMPKLFYYIEKFLQEDAEPGKPRTYTRAVFDPKTGALERYVRSVMSTGDRVEINVAPLKAL